MSIICAENQIVFGESRDVNLVKLNKFIVIVNKYRSRNVNKIPLILIADKRSILIWLFYLETTTTMLIFSDFFRHWISFNFHSEIVTLHIKSFIYYICNPHYSSISWNLHVCSQFQYMNNLHIEIDRFKFINLFILSINSIKIYIIQ